MATGAIKDGDLGFARGMDSVSDPLTLAPQYFTFSTNMLNRGGAMQTRPGIFSKLLLPPGQLQGLKVYTPRFGIPSLVAFVNGVAYSSTYPFTSYREVLGAHLSAEARSVYTAQTTQALTTNLDGSVSLVEPRSLLMAQDGVNPAIHFDGNVTTALTGPLSTPQGTHMAWAGGRLWVARRNQLFAGDIADPTSFTEITYNTLGGQRFFILDGNITGLAPLPSSSAVKMPLLAFTDQSTSMFRANILNRAAWPEVEDFQTILFPKVGCVAPRSIVAVNGMLWWFSDFGLVRLDSAANSYITSKLDFFDREMVRSGAFLSEDVSGIASAGYENFCLTSVPHANLRNKHTWVYDASTNDLKDESTTAPSAWASIWTGIAPVEWASINIYGRTRLFCAAKDDDGNNRIYEAFSNAKRDKCTDIPWSLETRSYTGGTMQKKHFRYAEYALSEIAGQVDMKISWAGGSRGRWKPCATPTFLAREGNVEAGRVYEADENLLGLKKQSRVERTQDVRDLPEDSLSSAGIEGQVFRTESEKEAIDSSFALRFEGSGQVAIRAVRLFMDLEPEPDGGMQDNTELDEQFVRFDGAAATTEAPLQADEPPFTATKTERAQVKNYAATATVTTESFVSQSDADKRASQAARCRAEAEVRFKVPAYVGGSKATPVLTSVSNSLVAWNCVDFSLTYEIQSRAGAHEAFTEVETVDWTEASTQTQAGTFAPGYYRVLARDSEGQIFTSNVLHQTEPLES